MSEEWEKQRLQDILAPGLDVVFVGFNPGKRSAEVGHHFAGVNNHFWKLLFQAGLTPRQLKPEEDESVLTFGLGLTNIVARPSRSSSDLGPAELRQGGADLAAVLAGLKPKIVCLLGKDVYRAWAGLPSGRRVEWGRQKEARLHGSVDFMVPNPSSRSTIPFEERLAYIRDIADLRSKLNEQG